MAYTTIDDPTIYFNTVLYTGNASSRSITGVGFQPDMVWTKSRGNSNNHNIYDVVRGATKRVFPNSTTGEMTTSTTLTSFDSDGFSLGGQDNVNADGITMASWNWKASNSTANDTTSGYLANTQSVNETAGFTVLKYTGSATNTVTNTGLSDPLDVSITKRLDDTGDWIFWHRYNTGTVGRNYLKLNTTDASQNSATIFQNIAPQMDGTKSYQAMGSSSPINVSGAEYISYGFSSRKGFSKFGSYTGNGNADGTFIYTGFKPAWVIFKRSDGGSENWLMYDNKRNTFNVVDKRLYPDANDSEDTGSHMDFVSNGIKLKTSTGGLNSSGATYIFMAFAESPFVTSTGIPTTAR